MNRPPSDMIAAGAYGCLPKGDKVTVPTLFWFQRRCPDDAWGIVRDVDERVIDFVPPVAIKRIGPAGDAA